MTGDWSEAAVTWANEPGTRRDPVSDAGAIAVNAKVEYDVTSLLAGNGPLDLALISTVTDAASSSRTEHLKAGKFPVLEVTFGHPYDDTAPSRPGGPLRAAANGSNVTSPGPPRPTTSA